jgi:putative hydrolase of the HAD superfamily
MIPSALILDYGEVLTRPQPRAAIEQMASIAGLPLDDFVSRYWRHRPAYDGGLDVADYWQRVVDGRELSPARLEELIAADASSWSDFREEVWAIAAAFRARENRTAMLSNGVPEIIGRIRSARPLDRWFDVVVVSCEVGCCKPDPEIYRICLEGLQVPAGQALFVDDRPENLEAAAAGGLRTLHFRGDESVPELRRLLDL